MKLTRMALMLTAILALTATTAIATTYYTDSSRRDDSGDGTSWDEAEKTIAAGLTHLQSGDTLKIKSGTYDEAIVLDDDELEFDADTRIETDDGFGNPGVVILTGSTEVDGTSRVIYLHNIGQLTIDGRQSVMEGGAAYGFVLNPSSPATGIFANEYSANGGPINIMRVEVLGVKPGTDTASIDIAYAGAVEISYCRIQQTGGYDGDCLKVFSAYSPGPLTTSGSIHHNDIQCYPADGYGAITQKRTNGIDVYNNWIHDLSNNAVGIILRDQEFVGPDGSDVYNNVIDNSSNMKSAIQIRGMTGGDGGGTDNARVFNNTIINNTAFSTGGLFMINDGSENNQILNNLVIGDVINFVASWRDDTGSGNTLHDNYCTGQVSAWFESDTLGSVFSITTTNYADQGTDFIRLNGTVPADYCQLIDNQDGSSLAQPDVDFLGADRGTPPDVGAFEYRNVSDTTPPLVSITAPAMDETVSGQITLVAEASDISGISGVQFIIDGADHDSEDSTQPYQATLDTTTLSAGTHTVAARARDNSGNQATSDPVTISVDNANTASDPGNQGENSSNGCFTASLFIEQ